MSPIDKELSYLFLATAFTNMYVKESKKGDVKIVNDLLADLGKRAKTFIKRAKPITVNSLKLFDNCQEELKEQNKKRFAVKAVENEEGDFIAHGLLFATALILEHKELKNKKLFLPYAKAQQIYNDFEGINEPNIKNSRVLAKFFADKLNNL